MSSTMTQEITVAELSKYGVKVGNEYVNYSKQLDEKSKGKFVPGGTYTVEMYVADSGKRYINNVMSAVMTGGTVSAKPLSAVSKPKAAIPNISLVPSSMSKDEWADKDRRISRQGCIQVAVQVASTFEEAKVLALQMLEFVNEK